VEYVEVQGERLPAIAFGTGGLQGEVCAESVRDAIAIGYRHIDTARLYGNESDVGEGIRSSGVDRSELFVTTKLGATDLAADQVGPATDESLERLGIGSIDLLLIHFPSDDVPLDDTLDAMVDQQKAGKVRHIGVSNFRTDLLRQAMARTRIFTDQVPYQTGRRQRGLCELVATEDIVLSAYSPLRGRTGGDPVMEEIASAHGKSPSQVALRWVVQQRHVFPITRSSSPERRRANFAIFDFELSTDEMERIFALSEQDANS